MAAFIPPAFPFFPDIKRNSSPPAPAGNAVCLPDGAVFALDGFALFATPEQAPVSDGLAKSSSAHVCRGTRVSPHSANLAALTQYLR